MNLVISGPTATGKSALAILLAKELRGEIINLDSVQVYRGLDIGSGKLQTLEREGVPHHLIDVCDPDTTYNGAKFVKDAKAAAASIRERGNLPILCGGTTLWLSLFIHGLADLPSADPGLRKELSKLSEAKLAVKLEALDPSALERIDRKDRRRLERAIEASLRSGESQSKLYGDHGFSKIEEPSLILSLMLPRSVLYRRIDRRSESFFESGIVEEAKALYERFQNSVALKSLAYPEAIGVLESKLTLAEAIKLTQQKTRRFAKRQVTFWRNEPVKRGWNISPPEGEGVKIDVGDSSKPMWVYRWTISELLKRLKDTDFQSMRAVQVWRIEASKLLP